MSKQLALSTALSVLAMAAVALLGADGDANFASAARMYLPINAEAPALPTLVQLLPALQ